DAGVVHRVPDGLRRNAPRRPRARERRGHARRVAGVAAGARGLIDTHCHLLPRVDDGPRSDAESLGLARRLVEEGVTTVVCTAHFSDRFPTPSLVAHERHEELVRELTALGLELETAVAAEVSVPKALETSFERLEARAIGG